MNSLSFNINSIYALSAGLESIENWKSWAKEPTNWPREAANPKATDIPATIRRRMSELSKLAVQTAIHLSSEHHIDYAIFSSQYGEINRTLKLMCEILDGGDASPIAFSQSVHNTAAGLFTIATQKNIPTNSISGGVESFHCALLDAHIYLLENPSHQVLVIDADDLLPSLYGNHTKQNAPLYAVGLVVSRGDGISFNCNKNAVEPCLPPSLAFYANWLQEKDYFCINGKHQWQCKVK